MNAHELEGGYHEVARTIHPHPAFAEAVMEAACATDGWFTAGATVGAASMVTDAWYTATSLGAAVDEVPRRLRGVPSPWLRAWACGRRPARSARARPSS